MKKPVTFLFLLLICAAVGLGGCGLLEDKYKTEWESLGFPEQSAYVLFLDGNDLYVGAGYDGLWAADISKRNTKWEYLGHRVTDGERHFESGVQAIDIYNGKITIGYADPPLQKDGQKVGMWCSSAERMSWYSCDDGARQLLGGELWSSARSIIRSPHNPNRVLSGDGSIYVSTDSGNSWERLYPEPEYPYRLTSLYFGLKWHPANTDVVWAYGETGRFQPWLMRSDDGGKTWEEYFRVNVPRDNAFYSMAFDAGNPDIIYIGAQGAVIRSLNGGAEWQGEERVPALFTDSCGNFFYALQAHPSKAGVLFAGAAGRLYVSHDYGNTVNILDTPEELTFILDMWYDESHNDLYVAGDGGVFRLRNPVAAIQ